MTEDPFFCVVFVMAGKHTLLVSSFLHTCQFRPATWLDGNRTNDNIASQNHAMLVRTKRHKIRAMNERVKVITLLVPAGFQSPFLNASFSAKEVAAALVAGAEAVSLARERACSALDQESLLKEVRAALESHTALALTKEKEERITAQMKLAEGRSLLEENLRTEMRREFDMMTSRLCKEHERAILKSEKDAERAREEAAFLRQKVDKLQSPADGTLMEGQTREILQAAAYHAIDTSRDEDLFASNSGETGAPPPVFGERRRKHKDHYMDLLVSDQPLRSEELWERVDAAEVSSGTVPTYVGADRKAHRLAIESKNYASSTSIGAEISSFRERASKMREGRKADCFLFLASRTIPFSNGRRGWIDMSSLESECRRVFCIGYMGAEDLSEGEVLTMVATILRVQWRRLLVEFPPSPLAMESLRSHRSSFRTSTRRGFQTSDKVIASQAAALKEAKALSMSIR